MCSCPRVYQTRWHNFSSLHILHRAFGLFIRIYLSARTLSINVLTNGLLTVLFLAKKIRARKCNAR